MSTEEETNLGVRRGKTDENKSESAKSVADADSTATETSKSSDKAG